MVDSDEPVDRDEGHAERGDEDVAEEQEGEHDASAVAEFPLTVVEPVTSTVVYLKFLQKSKITRI